MRERGERRWRDGKRGKERERMEDQERGTWRKAGNDGEKRNRRQLIEKNCRKILRCEL